MLMLILNTHQVLVDQHRFGHSIILYNLSFDISIKFYIEI
jgi:hypothetical protein